MATPRDLEKIRREDTKKNNYGDDYSSPKGNVKPSHKANKGKQPTQ